MRTFRPVIHQQSNILGNDAQDWRLQGTLDIINRFHAGIQVFDEEGQAHADNQSDNDAQSDIQGFVGANRARTGHCSIDDADHRGLGQGGINVLGSNLEGKDLTETQQLLEVMFGIPVRAAGFGIGDVIGGGLIDFFLQAGQPIARGSYSCFKAD